MLLINDYFDPEILVLEKDYLIVYKPPRMHSAPLAHSVDGDTLLDWCVQKFPEIAELPGRKAGEGGLLHRLDYETQGLLLIARTPAGMKALLNQHKEGKIFKEYSALTMKSKTVLPGFPKEIINHGVHGEPRSLDNFSFSSSVKLRDLCGNSFKIQSAFRPYGPGRKAVRPVIAGGPAAEVYKDRGSPPVQQYVTEILETRPLDNKLTTFRLRLFRGFRHQIRSHLAWLGMPIINDNLYGGASFGTASLGEGFLGLRACSLLFVDPASGRERAFSIPPLEQDKT